jgi:hypothetical protein
MQIDIDIERLMESGIRKHSEETQNKYPFRYTAFLGNIFGSGMTIAQDETPDTSNEYEKPSVASPSELLHFFDLFEPFLTASTASRP